MGGPPLIIFGISTGLPKNAFRGMLAGFFFIVGIVNILLFFGNKLINILNIKYFLYGIIPLFLGLLFGIWVKNKTSEEKFKKHILFLIILVGTIGFVKIIISLL